MWHLLNSTFRVNAHNISGNQGAQTKANRRTAVALSASCVAFTFVYLVIATWVRNKLLNDSDTFWHIGVGNWILQHHRFPTVDPFSYTAFGKPWFAADWLLDLLFAVLYRAAQWPAVTEIVAITCALISGVLSFYLA